MTLPITQRTVARLAVPASETCYTLDNAWEEARRRLALIEACYDPGTIHRLDALVVWPGWRCLEVGGGGGSIARWLCQQVGTQGNVTATDIDTRFLDDLDLPNLEVLRHDAVTDPLPEAAFDLVHARAVLCHLAGRDGVLAKLVAALRPGGWLLLEEADCYAQVALSGDEYGEMSHWAAEAMRGAGADLTWARDLPTHLTEAGLIDVAATTEAPLLVGGSPSAELLQLTFTQLGERALAAGAPPGLPERACAALADPRRWFPGYGIVAAWGRRRV
jgi:SAM-dependent methyltransferase